MTEKELATLGLLVLTYCKQRGLTEAQVLSLFNATTVEFVFRLAASGSDPAHC
jgi:hypothetical protein